MCVAMCIDMCIDMHIDMCIDVHIDMCIDMCIDVCVDMCMDMCLDMCIEKCAGALPADKKASPTKDTSAYPHLRIIPPISLSIAWIASAQPCSPIPHPA